MKKIICMTFIVFLAASCGQDYNSSSGDYSQYAPIEGIDTSTADGARLLTAYKVFQVKCFQCHNAWSSYKSSAQWISAGLVSAGNQGASLIHTRLKNNGGDMPQDPISELTSEEFAAIEAWINGT
ncbi:MAG: hypothetical protein H7336_15665 [Bacteriovorax sp.]|nr:hypothetical protein [Bacteriovorax sp.]